MRRYERQMLVFSEDEQNRIIGSTVGLIGCGGLGTNVATALACAGVGRFVLIDPDSPEETNLNRQYVYCKPVDECAVRPKSELLADWIRTVNPGAETIYHVGVFDDDTSCLFDGCDILVDCLDSISGRMTLNRYSVESGKPLVHGGIDGFVGQVTTCIPGRTPCLSCMMGAVPESSKTPASIGAVVSAVGSMEAAEVLKLIAGRCSSAGTFLSMDLESWRFQTIRFERDPNCPICGHLTGIRS